MRKMLTVAEAAEPLGLTIRAVRLKIARRELPYRKMGRLIRIPSDELDRYLQSLTGCDIEEALEKIHVD